MTEVDPLAAALMRRYPNWRPSPESLAATRRDALAAAKITRSEAVAVSHLFRTPDWQRLIRAT